MSAIDDYGSGKRRWTTLYKSSVRIANAETVKEPTTTKSSCVLIDEYTSHSTVHGMRYISKANIMEK